jgi:short subunit dehydrogenase-like uncharacterized protein
LSREARHCQIENYRANSIWPVNDATTQSGPIAVYGATGYTGRLIAAELRRRGADFVLAGRDQAKLRTAASEVGDPPVTAVALDDERGLRQLLEPCPAVIACAGPFQECGEPVLAAAVDSRTHYVDTTGEQWFMRTVFDEYGPAAQAGGTALVTAMGFDYAPGDMIAALTAEGMGPLDEVVLAYATEGFGSSRGTLRSALGMMAGGDLEWRDGALVAGSPGVGRGEFEFPPPFGRQRMVRYPAGEHLTVPRHVETRQVRTMLTASTVTLHPALAPAASLAMPALRLAARTPLRRALDAAISRLPEGPSAEARGRARFMVVCEARQRSRVRRGIVSGPDPYDLTARTTVEAALLCAAPGYARAGALAPSEAFDPREFLRGLTEFEVSHEVAPAAA